MHSLLPGLRSPGCRHLESVEDAVSYSVGECIELVGGTKFLCRPCRRGAFDAHVRVRCGCAAWNAGRVEEFLELFSGYAEQGRDLGCREKSGGEAAGVVSWRRGGRGGRAGHAGRADRACCGSRSMEIATRANRGDDELRMVCRTVSVDASCLRRGTARLYREAENLD